MHLLEARLSPDETGLPSPLLINYGQGLTPNVSFENDVKHKMGEHITAIDLRWVMYRSELIDPLDTLYAIYKDIRADNLTDEIGRRGLMYVLTVLRNGLIRGTDEWVRTGGHIATTAPGTSVRYPEVYEVLSGNGLLYLQNGMGDRANDTVTIPVSIGDKAVVAPGWASMLVNVGARSLVVGSWYVNGAASEELSARESEGVPMRSDSDLPLFHEKAELLERGGMAHYVLKDADGAPYYVPNPNYPNAPLPRTALPKEMPEWGLSRLTPLLTVFHENPDYFRFLLRPQDYETVWKTLYD